MSTSMRKILSTAAAAALTGTLLVAMPAAANAITCGPGQQVMTSPDGNAQFCMDAAQGSRPDSGSSDSTDLGGWTPPAQTHKPTPRPTSNPKPPATRPKAPVVSPPRQTSRPKTPTYSRPTYAKPAPAAKAPATTKRSASTPARSRYVAPRTSPKSVQGSTHRNTGTHTPARKRSTPATTGGNSGSAASDSPSNRGYTGGSSSSTGTGSPAAGNVPDSKSSANTAHEAKSSAPAGAEKDTKAEKKAKASEARKAELKKITVRLKAEIEEAVANR